MAESIISIFLLFKKVDIIRVDFNWAALHKIILTNEPSEKKLLHKYLFQPLLYHSEELVHLVEKDRETDTKIMKYLYNTANYNLANGYKEKLKILCINEAIKRSRLKQVTM